MGPLPVSEETRDSLTSYVAKRGDLHLAGRRQGDESEQRVGELLGLIAATPEFHFA